MQFVKRLGVAGSLLVQGMLVCLPESANGVDQIGEGGLPFSDCSMDAIPARSRHRLGVHGSLGLRVARILWRNLHQPVDAGAVIEDVAEVSTHSPVFLSFTSSSRGLVHSCGKSFSVSSWPPIVNQRNEVLPLYLTFEPQCFPRLYRPTYLCPWCSSRSF
jgi:hypothetical protein